jgi:hypothetical protein
MDCDQEQPQPPPRLCVSAVDVVFFNSLLPGPARKTRHGVLVLYRPPPPLTCKCQADVFHLFHVREFPGTPDGEIAAFRPEVMQRESSQDPVRRMGAFVLDDPHQGDNQS